MARRGGKKINQRDGPAHQVSDAVKLKRDSKNPHDVLGDLTNWGTAKSDYGEAIQEEVVKFYNLYNYKDKLLGPNSVNPFSPYQIYPSFEGDLALGQSGFSNISKNIITIKLCRYKCNKGYTIKQRCRCRWNLRRYKDFNP